MKIKIANVCLVVAILLFFSGFMMLCDCGDVFILSGIFSAMAIVLGAKKIVRVAGVVVLVSSLTLAVLMFIRGD